MNNDATSSRVALYARVSSEAQTRDGTIESQLEALRQRIIADNAMTDQELSFIDDGYSGTTLIRPALDRLRDQAAAGVFCRLYVHSPDRLARRYAYQVLLAEELKASGVEVVFLNRSLGENPEDNLLLQVQGMVAEYERAKILERSRRGKQHAAQQGSVSVLGRAPYGYRYHTRQMGGGQAKFMVHFEEARIVNDMFTWMAMERVSLYEIARRLKAKGIPSVTGQAFWNRGTLHRILHNPCYKGCAAFGKHRSVPYQPRLRPMRNKPEQPRRPVNMQPVPPEQWINIPVPAIVDAAVFDAVQQQFTENRQRHRRASGGAKYLLQGLIVCRDCGFAMCGCRTRGLQYYRCIGNNSARDSGIRVCQSRSIHGEPLDQAVWKDVQTLLNDPWRVEAEYQRRRDLSASQGKDGPDAVRLQKQVGQARRQIERLIDAYGQGLINKSEFEPRIRSTRDYLTTLETDLQSHVDEQRQLQELRVVIDHLKTFADRVRDGLDGATDLDRRAIVQALVKRIEVDAEKVNIVYRVNCVPFALGPKWAQAQDCRARGGAAARRVAPSSTHLKVRHLIRRWRRN